MVSTPDSFAAPTFFLQLHRSSASTCVRLAGEAMLCVAALLAACSVAPTAPPAAGAQGAAPAHEGSGSPATGANAPGNAASSTSSRAKPAAADKPGLDRSGSTQVGKASFYADKFSGRKMADGTRMDPNEANAASKTLPLGTTAKVTNVETGQSAVVTIQDRGPYVKGRIVDLSPATAKQIGMSEKDGVAKVEVQPLSIPQGEGKP